MAFELDLAEAIPSERADMRAAAGRIFTLVDGVWTDAQHEAEIDILVIEAYSAAYFDVLRALPEIAPAIRELDQVLIGGASMSVQVREDGIDHISRDELAQLVERFRGEG
jgi:hypothetical protein